MSYKPGIRRFKEADLDSFKRDGSHLADMNVYHELILSQNKEGTVYTGVGSKGEVIAVGGVIDFWHGYGEAWVVYSRNIQKNLRHAFNLTRTLLSRISFENKYRRIEANCRDEHKQCKFLEKLGFNLCAMRKGYFPDGTDSFLYEMVV